MKNHTVLITSLGYLAKRLFDLEQFTEPQEHNDMEWSQMSFCICVAFAFYMILTDTLCYILLSVILFLPNQLGEMDENVNADRAQKLHLMQKV